LEWGFWNDKQPAETRRRGSVRIQNPQSKIQNPKSKIKNSAMMDEVTLCNDALARLGEMAIMSLSDQTAEARLCKRYLQVTVREVLRDGVWRCARRRAVLPALAEKPVFGWAEQFELPGDFVRLVELGGKRVGMSDCPFFEIEGSRLLMNCGVAHVVYVRDVLMEGDPGMVCMEPLLARACAVALARKLVFSLQMDAKYVPLLTQEYDNALRDARSANTRDGFQRPVPSLYERLW
jgi:hypothetical protein